MLFSRCLFPPRQESAERWRHLSACANMAHKRQENEILRVLLLCVLWYLVSSSNNVVGKTLLNEFPYPMTVTMVQLVSISLYSSPVLRWMGVRRRAEISWSYYKKIVIPLAFGKFLASVSSHISIWRVPVSYAHTGKENKPLTLAGDFGDWQHSTSWMTGILDELGESIWLLRPIFYWKYF